MVFVFREWHEGLIPSILRKSCLQMASSNYQLNIKPIMRILQLDGVVSRCIQKGEVGGGTDMQGERG